MNHLKSSSEEQTHRQIEPEQSRHNRERKKLQEVFSHQLPEKILNYLEEYFGLIARDLPPDFVSKADRVLESVDLSGNAWQTQMNGFLLDYYSGGMFEKSISGYLKEKYAIDWETADEDRRVAIIQYAANEVRRKPFLTIKEILINCPHVQEMITEVRLATRGEIDRNRARAIERMEKDYLFLAKRKADQTYTEDGLNERFILNRREVPSIRGYCDSATFGIEDSEKAREAIETGRRAYLDFPVFVRSQEKQIRNYFYPSEIDPEQKKYREIHFFESASEAFRAYATEYIKNGDHVLVSSEEYKGILNLLKEHPEKKVYLHTLPPYSDNNKKAWLEEMKNVIQTHPVRHLLMSEISRRGTLFPLAEIRSLLDTLQDKPAFIVDGTQAIGRKVTRFEDFTPDGYFASCRKGSDMGGPGAVLVLRQSFTEGKKGRVQEHGGTQDAAGMRRFAMACDREETEKRQTRINELAHQLVQLISAINAKNENQIKILYPADADTADTLSGIFELKIEGATSYRINCLGRPYGVFISNQYFDASKPKRSFRIAIHPYMNEDTIKLLGAVLEEASRESKSDK